MLHVLPLRAFAISTTCVRPAPSNALLASPISPSSTMPANSSLARKARAASKIACPRPGCEAIISPTTATIKATVSDSRMPARMSGSAFGRPILRMKSQTAQLQAARDFQQPRLHRCKAVDRAQQHRPHGAEGNDDQHHVRAQAEDRDGQRQQRRCRQRSHELQRRLQVLARARATRRSRPRVPRRASEASSQPSTMRQAVARVNCASSPPSRPSRRLAKVASGVGRKTRLIQPPWLAAHHSATSDSVTATEPSASRGAIRARLMAGPPWPGPRAAAASTRPR